MSSSGCTVFSQLTQEPSSWHCPQTSLHGNQCFTHRHRLEAQPVLHVQRIMLSGNSAAAELSVKSGMYFPPSSFHPNSRGSISPEVPIQIIVCK